MSKLLVVLLAQKLKKLEGKNLEFHQAWIHDSMRLACVKSRVSIVLALEFVATLTLTGGFLRLQNQGRKVIRLLTSFPTSNSDNLLMPLATCSCHGSLITSRPVANISESTIYNLYFSSSRLSFLLRASHSRSLTSLHEPWVWFHFPNLSKIHISRFLWLIVLCQYHILFHNWMPSFHKEESTDSFRGKQLQGSTFSSAFCPHGSSCHYLNSKCIGSKIIIIAAFCQNFILFCCFIFYFDAFLQ